MRIRTLIMTAVLPAALTLVGCGPASSTGGGSTTKVTTTTSSDGKTEKTEKVDATFKIDTIKILPLTTTLKQEETKTYDLSISRGKDFKDDVELSSEGPDKLKVELLPKKVEASSKGEFQMKVTAAADAPAGEHTIKLTGKSAHGEPAHTDIKFKVEAKK